MAPAQTLHIQWGPLDRRAHLQAPTVSSNFLPCLLYYVHTLRTLPDLCVQHVLEPTGITSLMWLQLLSTAAAIVFILVCWGLRSREDPREVVELAGAQGGRWVKEL